MAKRYYVAVLGSATAIFCVQGLSPLGWILCRSRGLKDAVSEGACTTNRLLGITYTPKKASLEDRVVAGLPFPEPQAPPATESLVLEAGNGWQQTKACVEDKPKD
ncbi:hypothetical protein, variant [Cladophialophora immunda]|uniref:Uncharacterized protein n=1 Tax=Cladophialophora immunda TaxID=569365 RepID=A0A0D2B280_9EURO|nr:uncharacterized protein PV07_03371 [Cladophialophora immunda]XP_016251994.1 hypothetical protein, variant [Cladophialophora immunda]KIW31777.1 hypothetical protein PV07_03371 [Cladophialophora immunda]KIW31778.1 hypothetical protein, variant [Cladophialophora immunda]